MKKQLKHNLCHEIEIYYKRPLFKSTVSITQSQNAEKYLREYINPNRIDVKEFFWVLLLSNANKLLGIAEISSGTSNACFVNLKEVLQLVLKSNASAVVLAHNHPSGKLTPSQSDINLTEKCKTLLDIMMVKLIDHIIITSESYYSFANGGLL